MNSKELSIYLEKIRLGRKLSQEDFVFGVVSIRQYQRYRRGESELPYEKLDQFAEKLGIPTKKLLSQFESEKNKQVDIVNEFYNAVATRNLEKAEKKFKEIKQDLLIESETKIYFQHACNIFDFSRNKITRQDFFAKNSKLINFPEILKQDYFTDIELLILSSMLDYVDMDMQIKLLDRLSELYENTDSIMSSQNNMISTLILFKLCKGFGKLKNYPKVIEFADIAIKHMSRHKLYHQLEYFYYYKALAYFRLEDYLSFEHALFRCYNVLHMEGLSSKIEYFNKMVKKDLEIDFDMFVVKYLQKSM